MQDNPIFAFMNNDTPLFDPVTRAPLRAPTQEEQDNADRKEVLLRAWRNGDLPQKERDAAHAELQAMTAHTKEAKVWGNILTNTDTNRESEMAYANGGPVPAPINGSPSFPVSEETPALTGRVLAEPEALPLKAYLAFDPTHEMEPPEGFVKSLVICRDSAGCTTFVAVNIMDPCGMEPTTAHLMGYSKKAFGEIISGPTVLEESEWR